MQIFYMLKVHCAITIVRITADNGINFIIAEVLNILIIVPNDLYFITSQHWQCILISKYH